jgi:hypothetical protein
MSKIVELIQADRFRWDLLATVASLNLVDCYIAAGFIRNLVWDYLHDLPPTPLNDVDVIYFSKTEVNEKLVLEKLYAVHQNVKWQLKNQAFMHLKNLDPAYKDSVNAMAYWPELETAIGARLGNNGKIVLASPFNIDAIFDGFITHNKNRDVSVFLKRVEEKKWLETWPKLRIRI